MTSTSSPAAPHTIRVRLLWILLLIPPILPIAQLVPQWAAAHELPKPFMAPYLAALQGSLALCWLIMAINLAVLFRQRPRAAQRQVRRRLSIGAAVLSVVAGLAGAITLGYLTGTGPHWGAAAAIAVPGLGLAALVRLGWPRSGLAIGGRAQHSVRHGLFAPGAVLAVAGVALAHFGDRVIRPRRYLVDGKPVIDFPVIGHNADLPLLYGLLTAVGLLLVCAWMRRPRRRALACAAASAGLLYVGGLTNLITGTGLSYCWYGLLPLAFAAQSIRLARRHAAGSTPVPSGMIGLPRGGVPAGEEDRIAFARVRS